MEAAAPIVEHWWAIAWLAAVSGMCLVAAVLGRDTTHGQRYRSSATLSTAPAAHRPTVEVDSDTASPSWPHLAALPATQNDRRLRSMCDALDAAEEALTRRAGKLWRSGDKASAQAASRRLAVVREGEASPHTTCRAA